MLKIALDSYCVCIIYTLIPCIFAFLIPEIWTPVAILGVVNTGLSEDLGSTKGRHYIHDAEQLR